MRRTIAFLAILAVAATTSGTEDWEKTLETAIAAFHRVGFADSRGALEAIADDSNAPPPIQARALFFLGFGEQRAARSEKDPAVAERLLRSATLQYERALKLDASLAGAWNNLGQAYGDQGRLKDAEVAYRKAIYYDEKQRIEFPLNLASLLAARGEWHEAATLFERILQQDPNIDEAFDRLVMALRTKDRSRLILDLWSTQQAGQYTRVLETSLLLLGDAPDEQGNDELLTLMVKALTGLRFASTDFQAIRERLEPLTSVDALARPVQEILLAYDDKQTGPLAAPWWGARTDFLLSDRTPVSPREAYRDLLIARGDTLIIRDGFQQAIRYYEAAATLPGPIPTTAAILKLAEVYLRTGQTRGIDAVTQKYQPVLDAASTQFVPRDWRVLAEYHESLSTLYQHALSQPAYQGVTSQDRLAPEAIYLRIQEERAHAEYAAQRANPSIPGEGPLSEQRPVPGSYTATAAPSARGTFTMSESTTTRTKPSAGADAPGRTVASIAPPRSAPAMESTDPATLEVLADSYQRLNDQISALDALLLALKGYIEKQATTDTLRVVTRIERDPSLQSVLALPQCAPQGDKLAALKAQLSGEVHR